MLAVFTRCFAQVNRACHSLRCFVGETERVEQHWVFHKNKSGWKSAPAMNPQEHAVNTQALCLTYIRRATVSGERFDYHIVHHYTFLWFLLLFAVVSEIKFSVKSFSLQISQQTILSSCFCLTLKHTPLFRLGLKQHSDKIATYLKSCAFPLWDTLKAFYPSCCCC